MNSRAGTGRVTAAVLVAVLVLVLTFAVLVSVGPAPAPSGVPSPNHPAYAGPDISVAPPANRAGEPSGYYLTTRPTAPEWRVGTGSNFQGIDPYFHYTQEPAPMGVADYGVTAPNGTAYAYATYAVRGVVTFGENISVSNASLGVNSPLFGTQLNVMLVFNDSRGNVFTYWVQDVAIYNSTSGSFAGFVDNIWNNTASGAQMSNSSVTGNGTIGDSSGTHFYYDFANASLPGVNASLTAPDSFTLEMDAFKTSTGAAAVAFSYYDGSGQVVYDEAEFPWATHLSDFYGFVVYGGGYDPLGIPYDLELTFGGPGGGSQTEDLFSELDYQLLYYNGNNFQAPSNAFDFGSETAEGSYNVADLSVYSNANGNLSALLVNGTGPSSTVNDLDEMYNSSQISELNFTGASGGGTLTVNGTATPFAGNGARLILYPGVYFVNVTQGSTTTPLGVCTLTPGHQLHVSVASPCTAPVPPLVIESFTSAPTGPTVGQSFQLSVATTGGSGNLSYAYLGLPPGCTSKDAATLECVPTTAGTFNVTVWVNSTAGQSESKSLLITVAPALPVIGSFTLSAATIAVGGTVTLAVMVTGGEAPFSYSYAGLPAGCTSSNSATLACTPSASGTFTITVTVTDALKRSVNGSETLDVTPAPAPSTGGLTGSSVAGVPNYLWIVIVVLLVAIIAVLLVRSRRRGRSRSEYPPTAAAYGPPQGATGPGAPGVGGPPPPGTGPAAPGAYAPVEPQYAPAPYGPPAAPSAVAAPVVSPPPPPAPTTPTCPRCGAPITYISQYSRWYCTREQSYI